MNLSVYKNNTAKIWEIYERVMELGGDTLASQIHFKESDIQDCNSIEELNSYEQMLEAEIIRLLMELGNEKPVLPLDSTPIDVMNTGDLLSNLFRIFTHLQFSEDDAIEYWNQIIDHENDMNRKLGRRVGLRVAMMDYFSNCNKLFENPKIIEINLFDDMLRMSFMDELTGVYNRRFFNHALIKEFNRGRRYDRPVSLLVFDIDNFKDFNDNYGHKTGDRVLNLVGRVMEKTFRLEDSICRIGGEEFAVILPEVQTDSALKAADRFRENLAEESISKCPQRISVSGGISGFPQHCEMPEKLYQIADEALYSAKSDGKNRILIAS